AAPTAMRFKLTTCLAQAFLLALTAIGLPAQQQSLAVFTQLGLTPPQVASIGAPSRRESAGLGRALRGLRLWRRAHRWVAQSLPEGCTRHQAARRHFRIPRHR